MKLHNWISITLFLVCLTSCGKPPQQVSESPAPAETPSPAAQPSPSPQSEAPVAANNSDTPSPGNIQRIPIESLAVPAPPAIKVPTAAMPTKVATKELKPGKLDYPTPAPVKIAPKPEPVKIAKNKAIDKQDPASKLIPSIDPERKITASGIGQAKVGMTLGELKQKLGKEFKFEVKSPFISDFDAVAVVKNRKVEYYIPYPSATKLTDGDRIQHLVTDNPNYRTEQGIGPGTRIAQASGVYGSPTFSFSRDSQSGEFVNFTQNPNGIAFRPKPPKNRDLAGVYPESNEDYLQTEKYDPRTSIGQIRVSCGDECDSPAPESGTKDNKTSSNQQSIEPESSPVEGAATAPPTQVQVGSYKSKSIEPESSKTPLLPSPSPSMLPIPTSRPSTEVN
jgi:hypothetical protein